MAVLKIRNAGEEREEEPMVSQKVLRRVIEDKDNQYKDMRHTLEERLSKKNMEVGLHVHNEKQYLRMLKDKDKLIYIATGGSFFVGGLLGWLMN